MFRSTPHNGGHCENAATASHCDNTVRENGDGNFDYCDATSIKQVQEISDPLH